MIQYHWDQLVYNQINMKKHFYSHLVSIDSVLIEIGTLEVTYEEREHLRNMAESTIHYAIMSEVLEDLTPEERKVFLQHVMKGEHDKVWKLFDKKVEKIEEKILRASDEIKSILLQDIENIRDEK